MSEIVEKVTRYEAMLRFDLERVEIITNNEASTDFLVMARSYYEDGLHFRAIGDLVNALVCFSYGHGWLDAGVRVGALRTEQTD
jgi:uncharacterized protein